MMYEPLTIKTFIKHSISQWFERDFEPIQGMKTIIGGMSATPLYRRYFAMYQDMKSLEDTHLETGLVSYALDKWLIRYDMNALLCRHDEYAVDVICKYAHMLERGITSVWFENEDWGKLQAWGKLPSSLFF